MKIALCCIGKCENQYIREYVEYYKNLGVDKIFLYDNNDDKKPNSITKGMKRENEYLGEHFESVIGDYTESGYVEIINYRNRKICQLQAYQDCYDKHNIEYDWIMFFDCDEFMTITDKPNYSIKNFLSEKKFAKYGIIHINMCIYDDNGLLELDGRGVLERFTHRAEGDKAKFNNGVKSIIRGGLTQIQWKSTPHTPISPYSTCDGLGNEIIKRNSPFNTPNTDGAYLKHFKCKTISEYVLNKMGKGSYPDQSDASAMSRLTIKDFFEHNEWTQEKEDLAYKLIDNITHKDLTIEAHILCFNEVKLAPFAMQYWEHNFDHIYIYDNGSNDGTFEKLREMPNVTIYTYNSNNELNDDYYLRIKEKCWKSSCADFVVVSDFDEFVYSKDLKGELKYMKENGQTIARLNGYEMVSDEFPLYDENKLSLEIIKYGTLNEMMCKPILFSPKDIECIGYSYGCHYCTPKGNIKWYDGNNIFLLHHKFLSKEYITQRYSLFASRLSEFNKEANLGTQYLWSDEKISDEFNYIKENAINVFELANESAEKLKPTVCVAKLKGSVTDIISQVIYGVYYSETHNKEFYCYSNNEDIKEIYKSLRSTLFRDIKFIDNLNLLMVKTFYRITELNEFNEDTTNDNILIEITPKNIFNYKDYLVKKLHIFDNNIINELKELYNEVDFTNMIALYINGYNTLDDIGQMYYTYQGKKNFLIFNDDIEWARNAYKKNGTQYATKYLSKYPKEITEIYLQILCSEIYGNSKSDITTKWASYLKG